MNKKIQQAYLEALKMDANKCRLENKSKATTEEIIECRKLLKNKEYNIYRLFEE